LEVEGTEAFFDDLHLIPVLMDAVGLPDGNWQFAVCAIDDTGNFSDPFQAQKWTFLRLKFTPPVPVPAGDLD
jgi:hypothetical protein